MLSVKSENSRKLMPIFAAALRNGFVPMAHRSAPMAIVDCPADASYAPSAIPFITLLH